MSIKKMKVSSRSLNILFRYLTEIVIIFIGITISFAFEQWREDQRQEDALIELTASLLNDTKTARSELSADLPISGVWISNLDSIRTLGPEKKIPDNQLLWFHRMVTGQFTFLLEAYSPTFMSAATTSQWSQIPDTIRTKIYRVYHDKLEYLSLLYGQQQENITRFRLGLLEPGATYLSLADAVSLKPDFTVLSQVITHENCQNLINQILITEKMCYKQNEATIKVMAELERDLEEYLLQLRD